MTARRPAAARSLIWLRDTQTPIFVVNAQRRVVLFNYGCEQLSGWPAGEVLGKRAEQVSFSDEHSLEALLTALAPPALPAGSTGRTIPADHVAPLSPIEACPTETPCQTERLWPHQHAEPRPVHIQHWPIPLPDQQAGVWWLGLVGELQVRSGTAPVDRTLPWHRELSWLRLELKRRYQERSLIGKSPAMSRVFEQARLARSMPVSVFISGEAGVGKGHLARAIHQGSPQDQQPLVEIFGRLTPPDEQKHILRRLQQEAQSPHDGTGQRPGALYISDLESLAADVLERLQTLLHLGLPFRVLTSSSQSLEQLVAEERLSQTLAWQLSTISISLPPLRERDDDVLLLAQYFLEQANRQQVQQVAGFDDAVARQWRRYPWPGNVAELEKVVREAHSQCPESLIQEQHLPFRFRAGVAAMQQSSPSRSTRPLDAYLEAQERDEIRHAIGEAQGNLTLAAELLQIPRARLYRRLDQLGLKAALPPASHTPAREPATSASVTTTENVATENVTAEPPPASIPTNE